MKTLRLGRKIPIATRQTAAQIPASAGPAATVREIVQRKPAPRKAPPLAAPLRTGLLPSKGFGDWHYVAYLEEKRVLLGRHILSGNLSRRIGTVPWITRNPGNITVSTEPESKTGPGPKEAFRQGAYAKGAGQLDKDTRRYAIFPTVAKGLAAIWPQLAVINRGNGGKLTLIAAMKIFKGVEANEKPEVKDAYVAAIQDFMVDEILVEAPSLSEADARREARRILNTPFTQLEADSVDFEIARNALVIKEGGLNAPGIDYQCAAGFAGNERGRYSDEQWAAMERLKGAADVARELRALLSCD